MAMAPRVRLKTSRRLCRMYGEGSVERTKRNQRRMALVLKAPMVIRFEKALRRRLGDVPSAVYCRKSAGLFSMMPVLVRSRLQSRAVVERILW